MNLNQSCKSCNAIMSYKIKRDFGNRPLCDITRFFSKKELSQRLQIFKGMSAKNDSLLQIDEIVRIYANSKYLDRNVRWVLLFWLSICSLSSKNAFNLDKSKFGLDQTKSICR